MEQLTNDTSQGKGALLDEAAAPDLGCSSFGKRCAASRDLVFDELPQRWDEVEVGDVLYDRKGVGYAVVERVELADRRIALTICRLTKIQDGDLSAGVEPSQTIVDREGNPKGSGFEGIQRQSCSQRVLDTLKDRLRSFRERN